MENRNWLGRKPESNLDWLGVVCVSIAFYVLLINAGVVLDIIQSVGDVLTPFAAGIAIAYVVSPVVNWSYKHICRSKPKLYGFAMLLGYLVAFALVGALVYLVVSQVLLSMWDFIDRMDEYVTELVNEITRLNKENNWELEKWIGDPSTILKDTQQIQDWLTKNINLGATVTDITEQLLTGVFETVWGLASGLVSTLTALAASVYLLIAKDKLLRQARILVRAFLPSRVSRMVLHICSDANRNLTGFFTGKIIDSAIIGVLTYVCMLLLKLDYAAMISVIVGITNIIPVFGPFIGAIPGVLILLLKDPVQSLEFAVLILAIQQLDGNVIGPKILGDSIGISALWVLFSIVVGNALFGLVGMVIGVPVFATLYSLIREFAEWCLRQRGIDKEGNPLGEDGKPIVPPADPAVNRSLTKEMAKKVRHKIASSRSKRARKKQQKQEAQQQNVSE